MFKVNRENHCQELAESVKRMRFKDEMTDIILMSEGKTIKVHRLVLVTFSKYFRNLFDSMQFTNNTQFVVVMKDIPMKHIEILVDFMYDGEMKVRKAEWKSLLQSAQALGINGIQSIVYKVQSNQNDINPSNDYLVQQKATPNEIEHAIEPKSEFIEMYNEQIEEKQSIGEGTNAIQVLPTSKQIMIRKKVTNTRIVHRRTQKTTSTTVQVNQSKNKNKKRVKVINKSGNAIGMRRAKRRRRMNPEEFRSQHPCPICQKCFSAATILRNHIQAEHYHQRFECNICGEKIKWQPKFSQHMKQHRIKDGALSAPV
ncbi:hypothetical protein B4U80_12816 [Leptotrombidium deliense]|uniref:Uncharacterized protein n=1 Tax=Leptotrombidium deliense TaxID=299467 RepID=A0A443SKG2_9ACAR|nr:hypothetical protein B4U80_12816 [Leptotrombidium deliense]